MSAGIQKMQRKELKPVSDAIISLDKDINNADKVIDQKICKGSTSVYRHGDTTAGTEHANKCGVSSSSQNGSSSTSEGLSRLWEASTGGAEGGGNYTGAQAAGPVGQHTSKKISDDITELTRPEKGVVSSAFAKAHEGAEIIVK